MRITAAVLVGKQPQARSVFPGRVGEGCTDKMYNLEFLCYNATNLTEAIAVFIHSLDEGKEDAEESGD